MTTFEFECPHCGKVQIVQTSAYNDNFKGVDVACLPEGHRYDLVQRETGVGGIPGL
jgi:transcription elongation factor Elf1